MIPRHPPTVPATSSCWKDGMSHERLMVWQGCVVVRGAWCPEVRSGTLRFGKKYSRRLAAVGSRVGREQPQKYTSPNLFLGTDQPQKARERLPSASIIQAMTTLAALTRCSLLYCSLRTGQRQINTYQVLRFGGRGRGKVGSRISVKATYSQSGMRSTAVCIPSGCKVCDIVVGCRF